MRITCSCGKKLQVNDALAGKRVKCPGCGAAILAREDSVQSAPKAAPPRPTYEEEDDEDSPRPRPRRRDDRDDRDDSDEDRSQARGVSVLGIISLVLGILGAVISLFPCIGWFVGGPLAGIGLILGIIGLVVAMKGKQTGMGLPIAGTSVSFVGLVVAGAWLAWMSLAARQAGQQVQQLSAQVDAEIARVEQQRQAEAARAEQERQEIRQGPALDVTAAALAREYDSNAIGADRKYKGKVLAVKGQIERVSDIGFYVAVVLKTDAPVQTVECQFPQEQKNEVAGLQPGQQVTIRGKCKGKVGFSPTLEKCVLMR